jgi:hypothetical protein
VSPTQVGVKLQKKKGDRAALDMRKPSGPGGGKTPDENGQSETPGRPKNVRDSEPRKKKEFKPKTKASIELWAKEAQAKISEVINPGILQQFDKKNMRSLTAQEFAHSETIKFGVLFNLGAFEPINEKSIATSLKKKLPNGVITKCDEWISNATNDIERRLSIEEIRNIRVSFYIENSVQT